jgi:hypothetical protein
MEGFIFNFVSHVCSTRQFPTVIFPFVISKLDLRKNIADTYTVIKILGMYYYVTFRETIPDAPLMMGIFSMMASFRS